jgi:3',5'-cyclic-AMP phosphodiesterase
VLLAHLSDTHITTGTLSAAPAERCYQAFARVQELQPRPDGVVITGDLVERGQEDEYQFALQLLSGVSLPVHIIPGNHDHAPRMLQVLAKSGLVREADPERGRCYYAVDYPGLRILCCDSSIPGEHFGELGVVQLAWLESELRRDPDTPTILAMHHHPVPSGIGSMDRMMLTDAHALEQVLARYPPLVRIIIGHLHRPMITMFAGSPVVSAPSTFRQVALDLSDNPRGSFVDEPAGFLLHRFVGVIATTHLLPIANYGAPFGDF